MRYLVIFAGIVLHTGAIIMMKMVDDLYELYVHARIIMVEQAMKYLGMVAKFGNLYTW